MALILIHENCFDGKKMNGMDSLQARPVYMKLLLTSPLADLTYCRANQSPRNSSNGMVVLEVNLVKVVH